MATKKPKTGSALRVREAISKIGKNDGFVPPKPLPKKVKERKTKYDIPISEEQSDFNLRLFNPPCWILNYQLYQGWDWIGIKGIIHVIT